jgi:hypothetical protein
MPVMLRVRVAHELFAQLFEEAFVDAQVIVDVENTLDAGGDVFGSVFAVAVEDGAAEGDLSGLYFDGDFGGVEGVIVGQAIADVFADAGVGAEVALGAFARVPARGRVARSEAGGIAEGEGAAGGIRVPGHPVFVARLSFVPGGATRAQEARMPLGALSFSFARWLTVQRVALAGIPIHGEVLWRARVAVAARPEQ